MSSLEDDDRHAGKRHMLKPEDVQLKKSVLGIRLAGMPLIFWGVDLALAEQALYCFSPER